MKHIDFSGKRVLVRVDFNVPLSTEGEVTDSTRIERAIPTLKYILDRGASIILLSHLGRPLSKLLPDGSIDIERFSLSNIIYEVSKHLNLDVRFSTDCGGSVSKELADKLQPGEVLLLENTRFYTGEKSGDVDFARSLSDLGDIFINDAFGAAHRAHASTTTIAQFFKPEHKGFGLLMSTELENGTKVLNNSEAPFVAIIGGAKVSDKIQLISNLLGKTDAICIGGGMAFTFLKALGHKIGSSLCEEDKLDLALEILNKAVSEQTAIYLPLDSIIAREFSADAIVKSTQDRDIEDGYMGLDIGPKTITAFNEVISKGKTIVWNGPMGVFEFDSCSNGTFSIANIVAEATSDGAYSLIGGGDSVSAINKADLEDQVSFISTGGGAMLELLEGKKLPGVEAILNHEKQ